MYLQVRHWRRVHCKAGSCFMSRPYFSRRPPVWLQLAGLTIWGNFENFSYHEELLSHRWDPSNSPIQHTSSSSSVDSSPQSCCEAVLAACENQALLWIIMSNPTQWIFLSGEDAAELSALVGETLLIVSSTSYYCKNSDSSARRQFKVDSPCLSKPFETCGVDDYLPSLVTLPLETIIFG